MCKSLNTKKVKKFNLRRLGPMNQIVDNLDSKPSELEQRYLSDLKSDVKIWLNLSVLEQNLMDFDLCIFVLKFLCSINIRLILTRFQLKMLIKTSKMVEIHWKLWYSSKKLIILILFDWFRLHNFNAFQPFSIKSKLFSICTSQLKLTLF